MHSIVIVIISIALFAAVLLAGINNINIDYFNEKNKKNKVSADIANFASAFTTYESLKGFKLPATNWENNLAEISKYKLSTYSDGSSWSYNSNASGYYICLENSSMNKTIYNGIKDFSLEKEEAFLNENCGADENTTAFSEPTTFPAQAAVTYWLTI